MISHSHDHNSTKRYLQIIGSFIVMAREQVDVMRLALLGEWRRVVQFCKQRPMLTNDEILVTYHGDTILHLCAQSGRSDIMKELIGFMPECVLRVKNVEENTVLHEVAKVGMLDIAKIIVRQDEGLVVEKNLMGETPLYWAAMYGHINMFLYLSGVARENREAIRRHGGSTVLHAAITGKFYALALEILEQYEYLAWSRDDKDISPLYLLAQSPSSFKSGSIFSFHYVGVVAFLSPGTVWTYACIPVEEYKTRNAAARKPLESMTPAQKCKHYAISSIQCILLGVPLLRIICRKKLKHTYALQLTKELIKREPTWICDIDERESLGSPSIQHSHVKTKLMKTTIGTIERPFITATKMGIIEMLKEIVKKFPESLEFHEEESGKNVLHLAVENQHVYVWEWLKSMKGDFAKMVVGIDKKGNTVLHVAARWREENKPWHIRGPAHQMQWECVQYERVKKAIPTHMKNIKNSDKQTAAEVFTESHRTLVEKGEKWLKDFSKTCLLVSTLIATMMFASAFTFPGGNNEKSGFPLLIRNNDFITFIEYVSAALLFSVFSLGIFLSISTSRYSDEDFFIWLPLKTMLALTSLFNSVVYTVVAFCQGFILNTGWTLALGHPLQGVDVLGTIVGALCSMYIYLDITLSSISYLVDAIVLIIQSK